MIGTSGRRAEAEVGALLGAQLAQLPAVDGQHAGPHAALLDQRPARRASAPACAVALGERKKRSSSVALLGRQLEDQRARLGQRDRELRRRRPRRRP